MKDSNLLNPEGHWVTASYASPTASITHGVNGWSRTTYAQGFNLPLSKARAHSVVVWLTDHDVAADRLDARGYGKTRPIASNDTDEGRAQNRRVEIANPACKTAN